LDAQPAKINKKLQKTMVLPNILEYSLFFTNGSFPDLIDNGLLPIKFWFDYGYLIDVVFPYT